ncbi:Transposable element Tc1 transposase [Araneus ventricosus]|uniref:Transposable element Tc1 transposase n=1 Tax=Araneus ventricosus TaxID=182803 RepID=A0A4Y2FD38_ARAVE|nr:Transposable element Tc1 transposase [Araneus ventricosus]
MPGSHKVTTNSIRNLIIEHFKDGKSIRTIGKLVKVSHSTVFAIMKRWKLRGTVANTLKSGAPHKLTPRNRSFIMHKIKKNPRLSAVKLTTELLFAIKVNPETVRRVIRSYGYNSEVARRKFFVNERTRKLHLDFAKSMVDKDISFSESVIFVDESKFNIFGSDGRITVWRKPNEDLNPKNILLAVKHGGEDLMVWECFDASGMRNLVFIENNMDQYKYINILKENLKISAQKLGIQSTFKLHQDNDPKHTGLNVRLWLMYNCHKLS